MKQKFGRMLALALALIMLCGVLVPAYAAAVGEGEKPASAPVSGTPQPEQTPQPESEKAPEPKQEGTPDEPVNPETPKTDEPITPEAPKEETTETPEAPKEDNSIIVPPAEEAPSIIIPGEEPLEQPEAAQEELCRALYEKIMNEDSDLELEKLVEQMKQTEGFEAFLAALPEADRTAFYARIAPYYQPAGTGEEALPGEQPADEIIPVTTEAGTAQELYDALMACTSNADIEAIFAGLTPEQEELLSQFTPEQEAALTAKMEELGGGISLLADGSIGTITAEIEDSIATDGKLTLVVKSTDNQKVSCADLKQAGYSVKWEKKDAANNVSVVYRYEKTTGKYTLDENGQWVNVAYDEGAQMIYTVTIFDPEGGIAATAIAEKVDYYASIQNGSFETPACVSGGTYQPFIKSGTQGIHWKTTASTDNIEIVSADPKKLCENEKTTHKEAAETYHKMGFAQDGVQYAEINGDAAGALYQDVLTEPGAKMNWQVYHSGREGEDIMAVVIMATKDAENIESQQDLLKVISEIEKNPNKYPGAKVYNNLKAEADKIWHKHSNKYTVPEGQYLTRYFFVAIKTYTGKNTVGNHIDNVWFSTELPPPEANKGRITVVKKIYGLEESELEKLTTPFISYTEGTSETATDITFDSWEKGSDEKGVYFTASDVIDEITLEANTSYSYTFKENTKNAEVEGYNLTAASEEQKINLKKGDNDQTVTFENRYERDAVEVTIKKHVVGNMGDFSKSFKFTYTIKKDGETLDLCPVDHTAVEGEEPGFTLVSGGWVTFKDVPVGATITIEETEDSRAGYETSYQTGSLVYDKDNAKPGYVIKDYEVLPLVGEGDEKTNPNQILFINVKDIDPDTGISLDSLPYILMLTAAGAAGILLALRRRHTCDI